MGKKSKYTWNKDHVTEAVKISSSAKQVFDILGIKSNGWNKSFNEFVEKNNIDISHFTIFNSISQDPKWKQLPDAVKTSLSAKEAVDKIGLGLLKGGAKFRAFEKYVKEYNIDTSHLKPSSFFAKKWSGGAFEVPLEECFVKNSKFDTGHLKRKILKYNLLEQKCSSCNLTQYKCGITEWELKPILLHLDHINGDNTDNRIENLRFLCPLCHSFTSTYCGKNTKIARYFNSIKPSKEELTELLKAKTTTEISKIYGVVPQTVWNWALTQVKAVKGRQGIPQPSVEADLKGSGNLDRNV